MDRDELGERLRRMSSPEQIEIDRIVQAALTDRGDSPRSALAGRPRELRVPLAALAVCLIAMMVLGGWWWRRQQARTVTAGIYEVDALPAPPPGVYRVDAITSPVPSRVVSLKADSGTTWIVSTTPNGDSLPPGSAIVAGEGDGR